MKHISIDSVGHSVTRKKDETKDGKSEDKRYVLGRTKDT